MITINKIFRFEAAHAIHGYLGKCANIHGHSYELHVGVRASHPSEGMIDQLGIILDFKDLKKYVQESAINKVDHKLILSKEYPREMFANHHEYELLILNHEPTAENLIIYLRDRIRPCLPDSVRLNSLKLWETKDSFAEWSVDRVVDLIK